MSSESSSSSSSSSLPLPIPPVPLPVPPPRRPNPELANWPPSIKLLRAGKGIDSIRPDEHCFTYCSQSISGRNKGQPPFCRSLCIRRVFKHELKQLAARTPDGRQQALFMPDADRTEIIANYERLGMQIRLEEREIRVPLPAEGQRPAAFFAGRPRTGPLPPHEEPIPPRVGPMSAAQARKEALRDRGGESERGKEHGKEGHPPEPKMWEEGTYMWYTQNTWHAIDHLIMMRTNLQTQAAWERYQERMRLEGPPLAAVMDAGRAREYRDSRRETARKASRDVKDEQTTQAAVRDGRSGPGADATADRTPTSEASDSEYESVVNTRPGEWAPRPSGLPSFPNLEGSAILLPVAPELPPVDQYIGRALAPAQRVLGIFARSWENGAQQRFAARAWDKAFGAEWREPWRLLERMWDTLRKSGEGK